jgi:hypothetical protein
MIYILIKVKACYSRLFFSWGRIIHASEKVLTTFIVTPVHQTYHIPY